MKKVLLVLGLVLALSALAGGWPWLMLSIITVAVNRAKFVIAG